MKNFRLFGSSFGGFSYKNRKGSDHKDVMGADDNISEIYVDPDLGLTDKIITFITFCDSSFSRTFSLKMSKTISFVVVNLTLSTYFHDE